MKKNTVLHNYAHIFELLSRLRQALDHPYLVIHGPSADQAMGSLASSRGNSDVCGVSQPARPSVQRLSASQSKAKTGK